MDLDWTNRIFFEPYPIKVGNEWQLLAIWPNRRKEYVTGFQSAAEATEWLFSDRRVAWLKARGSD